MDAAIVVESLPFARPVCALRASQRRAQVFPSRNALANAPIRKNSVQMRAATGDMEDQSGRRGVRAGQDFAGCAASAQDGISQDARRPQGALDEYAQA
jgi:hypothetical protein